MEGGGGGGAEEIHQKSWIKGIVTTREVPENYFVPSAEVFSRVSQALKTPKGAIGYD